MDPKEKILEFPAGFKVEVYRMRGYEARPIGKQDIIKAIQDPMGLRPLRRIT